MALLGRKERIIATASSVVPSRLKVTRLMEPTRTCFCEIGLTHIMVGSHAGVSSSCLVMRSKQHSAGALMKILRVIVVALLVPGVLLLKDFSREKSSGASSTIRG